MKSNKILRRLTLYFVATFAVFALVIGVIFTALFFRRNLDTHKEEFTRRAIIVAEGLSEMVAASEADELCLCEAEDYLQLIASITTSDVRVVDRYLGEIIFGCRHRQVRRIGLPADAGHIIGSAFMGETTLCHRSFAMYLDNPYVTVATPITLPDGEIIGVLIMHTFVQGINDVTRSGIMLLLYSMLAGVLVSVGVAVMLSKRFTLPLSKMKAAAIKIGEGDYSASTRVKQRDEIGELAAVMDSMAKKLAASAEESKKLEKLRRDFVANISHELRTPITVIRGSLEALCDGVVNEPVKIKEYHDQMLWEIKYLGRLVSDLLDLSRLQNVDFGIEKYDVSLPEILDDVLASMKGLASTKDIVLDFLRDAVNLNVLGDYGRLRQMLIILLDNAIKFSPAGKAVTVVLSQKDDLATVSISDQGMGIPECDLNNIFERFYKQRSEHNKSGAGLGLAIAKEIADRHGATLQAGNHAGGGAEFVFTMACLRG